MRCSQIRQGIASNSKGTAFVVYEDVMDAKQACDKLNGFNFQNRYLVGRCCMLLPYESFQYGLELVATLMLTSRFGSPVPSAREDGQVKRGPRRTPGESGETEASTWDRITFAAWVGF